MIPNAVCNSSIDTMVTSEVEGRVDHSTDGKLASMWFDRWIVFHENVFHDHRDQPPLMSDRIRIVACVRLVLSH